MSKSPYKPTLPSRIRSNYDSSPTFISRKMPIPYTDSKKNKKSASFFY
jgi:hypothetical protein